MIRGLLATWWARLVPVPWCGWWKVPALLASLVTGAQSRPSFGLNEPLWTSGGWAGHVPGVRQLLGGFLWQQLGCSWPGDWGAVSETLGCQLLSPSGGCGHPTDDRHTDMSWQNARPQTTAGLGQSPTHTECLAAVGSGTSDPRSCPLCSGLQPSPPGSQPPQPWAREGYSTFGPVRRPRGPTRVYLAASLLGTHHS